MRRIWTELCRFSGLRSRVQHPGNSWNLAESSGFISGMDLRRDVWTDRTNGGEVQVSAASHVLGLWRGISSAAVGGQNRLSTELRGGLGPPTLFTSRSPFLEGSVRFKSQKKKNKKKNKNKTKASKEDRLRLRSLQRERKQRKLRMTPEESLMYRMHKAQRKIGLQEQALKKYALPERPQKPDDPEVMTPEQLHALKKLGYKNKNYVPVGRRGIYGGVIQNMHLHWKKHETVRVDCDNYKKDEVREMATELETLSGGKVIDIHQGTTIIMYRGKNYKQPKQLIPDNMLDKRKALLKSLIDQSLKSLREYVAKLEVELKALRAQMAAEAAMAPPQPSNAYTNDSQWRADSRAASGQLQDEDTVDELGDTGDDLDLSDLDLSSLSDSEDEDLGQDGGTVLDADSKEPGGNGGSDGWGWETDKSGSSDSDSEDGDQENLVASATYDLGSEEFGRSDHTILEPEEADSPDKRGKEYTEAKLDRAENPNLELRSLSMEQKVTEHVSVG